MANKIYIIGGGRSGKSFFAKQLSQKTGIPYFDLDNIVFIEIGKIERDEVGRDEELSKILSLDRWIIEGAYAENWIVSALNDADIIVWLDTPATIKLSRFFKQVISRGPGGAKNFYGRGKLVAGLKHKEWDRSRRRYHQLLEPLKEKLVIMRSKREINNFLKDQIAVDG